MRPDHGRQSVRPEHGRRPPSRRGLPINIDNDGDLRPDVAFSIVFSPPDDHGRQSATVRLATGEQARDHHASGEVIVEGAELPSGPQPNVVKAGPYTFAAGLRSDPFFADIDGFLNNFQWTGNDTIADKNVYSMALELLSELLGPSSNLALWARVSLNAVEPSVPWIAADSPP